MSRPPFFLEYKCTRLRITPNGEPIPNTSLGRNSISQIINALEKYQQNHQCDNIYCGHDDLNKTLRKYPDIQSIESALKVNEAKRQSKSQELKANGTQSETFSREQLMEVSVGLLNPSEKGQQTPLKCRDCAMLLLSTSMAMRGDNVWRIQWSNLSI
ncbi:hypothetical protein FA13DRAFT_1793239 [Coprinellus micaceus]|uniref:Uncharacterized protein n=1 Tax=Coprinellus micaceus TaxID=71717 RepID=A0A4Y7T5Y9_COPMI|nr:hypothetical protein FA13DRAFT_1793239 [Coprinellus micaceus]